MRWWIVITIVTLLLPGVAEAGRKRSFGGEGYGFPNPGSHSVRPHFRRDGTFSPGHRRTNPNWTDKDNYGTRPNISPWTGKEGTRSSKSGP